MFVYFSFIYYLHVLEAVKYDYWIIILNKH